MAVRAFTETGGGVGGGSTHMAVRAFTETGGGGGGVLLTWL